MTTPDATILIVEDEAKMRRLLELDLGDDGFQTVSAEDAETELGQILRELRTQYLIGYYPHGPSAGDGKYHRVRLEIPQRPDLHISTRAGYYGVVSR